MWPLEDNILSSYCNDEILAVTNHYEQLLTQNGCNIFQIPKECDRLKSYFIPILLNHDKRSTTLKSGREFSKKRRCC